MDHADVIAIGAVFRAQFPVALIYIARRTLKYLEPLRRRVDDQVDNLAGFPEIGLQRLHVGIEATE